MKVRAQKIHMVTIAKVNVVVKMEELVKQLLVNVSVPQDGQVRSAEIDVRLDNGEKIVQSNVIVITEHPAITLLGNANVYLDLLAIG